MESFQKIVALLAVIGVTAASEYPCVYSAGMLNCTSRGLNFPPPGYWPGVTWLFLTDNPIAEFPINSFSGLPDLTTVYSPNTNLKEIDFNDLAVMSNLEVINVQFNAIETLTASEEPLDNVKEVYLYENNIAHLDPNVFHNFRSLSELSMHNNPIVVTPGEPILNHHNLERLWLGKGSSMGELDSSAFAGLPNLRFASLVSANVTAITGAFASNQMLESVLLSGNPITRITSGAFASAGALKTLYLDRTSLIRLDTAAVNKALVAGGVINIAETPLACQCAYEALDWWAAANDVALDASCAGRQEQCSFSRRMPLGKAPPLTQAQVLGLHLHD